MVPSPPLSGTSKSEPPEQATAITRANPTRGRARISHVRRFRLKSSAQIQVHLESFGGFDDRVGLAFEADDRVEYRNPSRVLVADTLE